MPTEDYIELDVAAEQFDINIAQLYQAIKNGELTVVKGVFRGYRTKGEWIQAWIDRRTLNKPAEQGGK